MGIFFRSAMYMLHGKQQGSRGIPFWKYIGTADQLNSSCYVQVGPLTTVRLRSTTHRLQVLPWYLTITWPRREHGIRTHVTRY